MVVGKPLVLVAAWTVYMIADLRALVTCDGMQSNRCLLFDGSNMKVRAGASFIPDNMIYYVESAYRGRL